MMDGLKIVRTIQSTDRFDSYEASYEGRKVFAKKAKTGKTRELLARVPENSKVANRIGKKTNFRFRAPKVIEQNGDWLVTEWIEGESLAKGVEVRIEGVAEILVNFLIVLDSELVAKDQEVRKTFKSDSLSDYMAEKLPKNLSTEQRQVLSESKILFDKLQLSLAPSWQDGDIKPDHIFVDPQNKNEFVLIDPEHLDPRWPRFYSLANNFSKYWVRQPKKFSKVLVQTFMNKSNLPEATVFRPFLASVLVRGISLHWEVDYDPGAKSYNIPRSQAMLKLCLKARNLADLIG